MIDVILSFIARSLTLLILDNFLSMRAEFIYDLKKLISYRESDFVLPNIPSFFENLPHYLLPIFIVIAYNTSFICFFAYPKGIIFGYVIIFSLFGVIFGYLYLIMIINGMFSPYSFFRRQTFSYVILTSIVWLVICIITYWAWLFKRATTRNDQRKNSYAIPLCLLGTCALFMPFFVAEILRINCLSIPQNSLTFKSDSFQSFAYLYSKDYKQLISNYASQVCVDGTDTNTSLNKSYISFPFNPYVCLLNTPGLAPIFSNSCKFVINFLPVIWLLISLFLVLKFTLQVLVVRIIKCLQNERQRFSALQLTEFIQYHWGRLNVIKCFMLFWFIKTCLVVFLGPEVMPLFSLYSLKFQNRNISASFIAKVNSYIPMILKHFKHPDVTVFIEYTTYTSLIQESWYQTLYVFQVRFITALFAHGSENWISLFGTLVVLGFYTSRYLKVLVYILDPSGRIFERFERVLNAPPFDIDVWNALDNVEDGNARFHYVAAEMIHGADFFCIIPFVILAIQYDITKLCLVDRSYLFLHGLILTIIMIFYCFEAVLRSRILEMFDPNRNLPRSRFSSVLSHIQILFIVFFMGLVTFRSLIYVLNYTQFFELIQFEENWNFGFAAKIAHEAVFEGRRGLFSSTALLARKIKVMMCGFQWFVNILSNLIEYGLYMYKIHHPEWASFDHKIWLIRLISSITDYIFTVFSFLMILWLSIFDSFGIFRTMIMLAYLYFVIYPTAYRGYSWLRWRLYFTIRILTMRNPSQRELDLEGENCAICYEAMSPNTSKVTRCGHYFHLECLTTWMKRNPTCPMCHSDLLSKNVRNMRLIRYEESIIDIASSDASAEASKLNDSNTATTVIRE